MGLKALVIEDSNKWQIVYSCHLKAAGFNEVDVTENPRQALEYLKTPYNLIVSDTLDANGIPTFPDVIRRARDDGITTKVIANSKDYESKSHWEGIDNVDFVQKDKISSEYIKSVIDL